MTLKVGDPAPDFALPDYWSPIAGVEHQIQVLVRKLGLDEGGLDG